MKSDIYDIICSSRLLTIKVYLQFLHKKYELPNYCVLESRIDFILAEKPHCFNSINYYSK